MQQLLICPLPLVLFLCDLSSTLKQDDLLKNKTGSCHFSIYNLSIISHFYLCRVQIPWHVLQNYLLIFPISPFLSSCSMAQPYWSYFSSSKTLLSFWICTAMFLVFLEILLLHALEQYSEYPLFIPLNLVGFPQILQRPSPSFFKIYTLSI